MLPRSLIRFGFILCLSFAVTRAALAQSSGTAAIPPIPKSTGSAWAIGAGVAAGAGLLFFFLSRRSPASIAGCLHQDKGSYTLTDERDKQTYTLVVGALGPNPGDRVELKGKKAKDNTGRPVFIVQKIAADYGACSPARAGAKSPPVSQ